MLPSADAKFNYAAIPAEKAASARAAAERIRGRMQLAADSITEVGRELIKQKDELGHGNFLPWIQSEFGMSDETARKWMRVASEIGDKIQPSWNLPASTLYALSAPSTPEPVRAEALAQAAKGERVTAKDIERLKKQLEKLERDREDDNSRLLFAQDVARTAEEQRDKAQNEALFLRADKERLEQDVAELREEASRLQEDGTIHVIPVDKTHKGTSGPIDLMAEAKVIALRQWHERRRHVIEAAKKAISEIREEGAELFHDAKPPQRLEFLGWLHATESQFLDDLANPVTL